MSQVDGKLSQKDEELILFSTPPEANTFTVNSNNKAKNVKLPIILFFSFIPSLLFQISDVKKHI